MEEKSLKQINKEYDLELNRIIKTIKKQKPRRVLLQFADGLKPYAKEVYDFLNEKFPFIEFSIWFETCFGGCDIPQTDDDLIIQFGHDGFQSLHKIFK
jgi:2-(3-amino-3-carboxypropyl)histidine synthase